MTRIVPRVSFTAGARLEYDTVRSIIAAGRERSASAVQLAARYNCSRTTVRNIWDQHDIPKFARGGARDKLGQRRHMVESLAASNPDASITALASAAQVHSSTAHRVKLYVQDWLGG